MATEAQVNLFEQYRQLAYWFIYSGKFIKNPIIFAKICREDVSDLEQIALMGLWEAALRFDPEKQIAFTTFAIPVIRNKIYKIHRNQKKRFLFEKCNLSLDFKVKSKDTEDRTIHEIISDKSEMERSAIANAFMDSLPDKKKRIVLLHLYGFTQREIAKAYGISQVQVSRILSQVANA